MSWFVRRIVFLAPLILVAFLVFIALGGAVVLWLWNWLLPPLFGWPTITFWQALAMLALCRILFGGLGLHGGARSRMRERMAERKANMTDEQRERIRRGIRMIFGIEPSTSESKET